MNRTDLQKLADIRIDEAQSLLSLAIPKSDGAYYLAGYAVELALKACIAKMVSQHDWPEKKRVNESHTHDLLELVRVADLKHALDAFVATNSTFKDNWSVTKDWNERSRYERHSLVKAQKLIAAIIEPTNGVLPWIKSHW